MPMVGCELTRRLILYLYATLNKAYRICLSMSLRAKWRSWWQHQIETFSALLAFFVGNPLVSGELPWQRPVTRSFDVFFDLRLNQRLSKQSWGWWFETPLCPLWRHCNAILCVYILCNLPILTLAPSPRQSRSYVALSGCRLRWYDDKVTSSSSRNQLWSRLIW